MSQRKGPGFFVRVPRYFVPVPKYFVPYFVPVASKNTKMLLFVELKLYTKLRCKVIFLLQQVVK